MSWKAHVHPGITQTVEWLLVCTSCSFVATVLHQLVLDESSECVVAHWYKLWFTLWGLHCTRTLAESSWECIICVLPKCFLFFWCINIYWVHLGISPRSYGYTVNLSENASVWVCPSSRVCCQKENAQVRHSLSTVCLSSRADGNHGLMSERDTEVNFQTVTCGVVQFTYSSD